MLLVVLGFFALLIVWILELSGEINISLAWFITLAIFILGGVFYVQNETWEKTRLRELYKEELLELRIKK